MSLSQMVSLPGSYSTCELTSSITIPSSPFNSISHKRKRSENMDPVPYLKGHENTKKCQQHKIHTESHNNTIQMLMNSQKMLQEQERLQKVYGDQDIVQDEEETKECFTQKPFWPVINKLQG